MTTNLFYGKISTYDYIYEFAVSRLQILYSHRQLRIFTGFGEFIRFGYRCKGTRHRFAGAPNPAPLPKQAPFAEEIRQDIH